MRLILFDLDNDKRHCFDPLALSRPIWELRCGITTLEQKLIDKIGAADVAYFMPPYMADACGGRTDRPVNQLKSLAGDDLLLVSPCLKACGFDVDPTGPSEVGLAEDGQCLYARVARNDRAKLECDSIDSFIAAAVGNLPTRPCQLPQWHYIWELVLASPDQITRDFAAAGRSGIEATIEQPTAIRGSDKDIYVAPGAQIHPMVVIDAEHGPVYLDQDVVVHPFTRIEGPCYVGKGSTLLGAKCREGNSIGPVCRIGGEVEESIIQGYSNKYHDGFLGHAYVGEWVNLGALTTNSDLKNDYGHVEVVLGGKTHQTGSNKVGCFIGDHTKTSIGTLLNSGCVVGTMAVLMATGSPLPKSIPSFAWFLNGVVTKGFGRHKLYETAKTAMGRRNFEFDAAHKALYECIYERTKYGRDQAIRRGRRELYNR